MYFFNRFRKLIQTRNLSKEDHSFVKEIESRTGLVVKNIKYYREAFTHRTEKRMDANGNSINFERLEFLGDAFLGAVVAEYLFEIAPGQPEGYLTKMRSKIVSRIQLNTIGEELNLKTLVKISKDNALSDHIEGDLFEALVGAIYLDLGLSATKRFIKKKVIGPYGDIKDLEQKIISHKSLILEWSQKTKSKLIFNTFEEKNAEEMTVFVCILRKNQQVVAKGRGTSKKRAEEVAAKRAYFRFKSEINAM